MKATIVLPSGTSVVFSGLSEKECEQISNHVISGMSIKIVSSNSKIFAMNSELVKGSYFSFQPE